MAQSFSANQYQDAFISKKLTNWEQPQVHKERPSSQDGFTQIIGDERGHLIPGVPRSKDNPWGNFVGTWDLPKNIPGNTTKVKTSRSTYAQERLQREKDKADLVMTGQLKNEARAVRNEFLPTTIRDMPITVGGAPSPSQQRATPDALLATSPAPEVTSPAPGLTSPAPGAASPAPGTGRSSRCGADAPVTKMLGDEGEGAAADRPAS